jgi:group I intron endonuclease
MRVMAPYGFVYKTTNHITGKQYIGICSFQKPSAASAEYLGSGKLLKLAIKKYGRENFSREILQECDTYEELIEAEQRWIEQTGAVNSPNYYNLASGGYGGSSKDMTEYWARYTKEERKKIRRWSKRSKHGENNPMWGRKHSPETKQKIGAKSVNRNWHTPNHSGSSNPRAKRCRVYFNGKIEEYKCLKDFADDHNMDYNKLKYASRHNGREVKTQYGKIKIEYPDV